MTKPVSHLKTGARRWLPAFLLSVLLLQCGLSSRVKSPSVDEFVHLPVGYSLLKDRDFLVDPINPPLPRVWAALPLLLDPPKWRVTPEQMREGFWLTAYVFMKDNAKKYQVYFERGRWMITFLSLLLGIYVYVWAEQLYGSRAGPLALFLYVFSPNIIAHSRLITADLAGACFIFLTFYHSWRMRRSGLWRHSILAGMFFCLALVSKLSALFVFPSLAIIFFLAEGDLFRSGERAPLVKLLKQASLSLSVALLFLHAIYLFQGSFDTLEEYTFKSETLQRAKVYLPAGFPVPFPHGFIQGIDEAFSENKDIPEGSFYLMGELSSKGWWYYFLLALLIKIPVPVLVTLGLAAWLKYHRTRAEPSPAEWYLLVPALCFLLCISVFTSLYVGFRHILMVLPLLHVWVSELAGATGKTRGPKLAGWALGLWYIGSAIYIFPNHLAYFNELAGGPSQGYRYLIDSNLDWGQDLIQLEDYLAKRGNPEIKLAYFGRVDPTSYGIKFRRLGPMPEEGLIGVSASLLQGRPYMVPNPVKQGTPILRRPDRLYEEAGPDTYAWVRNFQPVAKIGYTIFIYKVTWEDIHRTFR